jgi:heavy metal efflux system protein
MMRGLSQAALGQRFLTMVACLAMAGLGFWAFQQLSIEAYPDLSDTQVVIVTQSPGHAAEEMEQQITVPIERALNNVPQVIARRSRSIFGLSVVELTFAYGTNDYFARQVVAEKLKDAQLPEGVDATISPLATPAGELYRYVIEGPGYSELDLRELQDWVITPRLLQAEGVGDVVSFGGLVKQYQIEVDPLALEKYNITIGQIGRAVGANNQNAGGAMLDNRQQSLVVRGVGLIRNQADIENIVLSATGGVPVFIRDVARVSVGAAPPTGIFGLNKKDGAVEGIVLMRRGENPSQVLVEIKEAIDDINASRLPPGVRLAPIYDRTELVNNTLHTVSRTLIEGLTIVFLVLFFFLGSFQAAVLTALTIPLSLLFAFTCMYFYGVPASLLSLGALDFGIIVDGTLVAVEFIVRRLAHDEEPGEPRTPFEIIRESARQVERPIFFSLLILVAAYIPLFTLERVERRLFTPMAFTVCAALIGSMIFALTVVPVMASYLFRNGCRAWRNPLIDWLTSHYERALGVLIRRAWLVAGAACAMVAGSVVLGSTLGSEFLPQLDEGLIWIRANLPPGISINKSAEIGTRMRALILQSPEVTLATSQSGRQDSGTEPFGPNRNEFLVALKPYSEWPSGKRKRDLVEELEQRLHRNVPSASLNFTQPIIDMVTESVTGSSADLAVIITGPDLNRLRALSNRALDLIKDIPGAVDYAIEQEADQPQLQIRIDRTALARYALNVADVQELIELAVGGKAVGAKLEGDRRFDITARYVPEARADITALGGILVHTPDGGKVPLSQLAAIGVENGSSIISRRENQRLVNVRLNIRGRDQGSFVRDAQRVFKKNIQLPPGYRVSWGGQFENLDRARRRLMWILPVTVAIIFALLYWAFNSARSALLVLANVPFSVVGGVVALWLRDINLSVSAAVGFISLFGVAVMSGVLYIAEIDRQRKLYGKGLRDAVITGACAQLRPRLILIIVAMLGMAPAAFATGIGSDIQRPLATVVLGGLVSTLLLTLLALPSLYYLSERRNAAAAVN